MTSKEKIDLMLGIPSGSSIDDFLDELSIEDDVSLLSSSFDLIDENVKKNIELIDSSIAKVNTSTDITLLMSDISHSLSEIEEMIALSKKIVKHVYSNIISTDLVDSELIGAAAKLLESIHINVSEFLSLYKERQRYFDKIKIMVFLQLLKKELMELKHKLTLEILEKRNSGQVIDAQNTTNVTFSYDDICKMIKD